jgi:hypothetical protein
MHTRTCARILLLLAALVCAADTMNTQTQPTAQIAQSTPLPVFVTNQGHGGDSPVGLGRARSPGLAPYRPRQGLGQPHHSSQRRHNYDAMVQHDGLAGRMGKAVAMAVSDLSLSEYACDDNRVAAFGCCSCPSSICPSSLYAADAHPPIISIGNAALTKHLAERCTRSARLAQWMRECQRTSP